jgi:hypothetical protein
MFDTVCFKVILKGHQAQIPFGSISKIPVNDLFIGHVETDGKDGYAFIIVGYTDAVVLFERGDVR